MSQYVKPTITNLGVNTNPGLKLDRQIRSVVKSSFFNFRQLAKIKPFLSRQHFETVIHTFVTTRLDYENVAARLLTGTRKYSHISPILSSLHWLPIYHRIHFKIILFAFEGLNGLAPLYISELLHHYRPTRSLRPRLHIAGYLQKQIFLPLRFQK